MNLHIVLPRPTCWSDLVAIEPELAELEARARSMSQLGGSGKCHHYEMLKSQASHLVGWNATDPLLTTSTAYEVVIDRLLKALEAPSEGQLTAGPADAVAQEADNPKRHSTSHGENQC
ncbi:MAG: hypothetical protein AAF670_11230 [Planctomycetota bacterium]